LFFAVAEEGLDIKIRGAAVMVGGATEEAGCEEEEDEKSKHGS